MKAVTEFSFLLGQVIGLANREDELLANRYGWDIMTRLTNLAADIYAKNIEIEKLENERWAEMESDK